MMFALSIWMLLNAVVGESQLALEVLPQPREHVLIWYEIGSRSNYNQWVDSLNKDLEVYRKPELTPGRAENLSNCTNNHRPANGLVCDIDINTWSPCTNENLYGYHLGTPCVFLKWRNIEHWVPEFYNESRNLPEDMPQNLKDHIAHIEESNPEKLNTVWVSCDGDLAPDKEFIGPVSYFPISGFPGYLFPYENQKGYLSPLLALQFQRPNDGILIGIRCQAWAKNIKTNDGKKQGSLYFELLIDSPETIF